jgi:FMN phosphatase YigB (HAD superfamily)
MFVDWHGVLSEARFWTSIRDHPAVATSIDFDRALDAIFTTDVVDEWMRGHLTTREVVAQFLVGDDNPLLVAFLEHQVIRECAESSTRRRLVRTLRTLKGRHLLVLATDNMDCFSAALPRRSDLRLIFDDYLTSTDLGVLKAEDPGQFFLPWLADHDVAVEDSLLVDDRRKNCDRFCEMGGQAIVFDGSPQMWAQLEALATT